MWRRRGRSRSCENIAGPAHRDESSDRLAGEEGLLDQAAGARVGDERPEVGLLAARREHDRSRGRGLSEAGGDLEPRHVGQADVEQDDVGPEPERLGDGRLSVRGRARPRRIRPPRVRAAPSPGTTGGRRRSAPSRSDLTLPHEHIIADRCWSNRRSSLVGCDPESSGGSFTGRARSGACLHRRRRALRSRPRSRLRWPGRAP